MKLHTAVDSLISTYVRHVINRIPQLCSSICYTLAVVIILSTFTLTEVISFFFLSLIAKSHHLPVHLCQGNRSPEGSRIA